MAINNILGSGNSSAPASKVSSDEGGMDLRVIGNDLKSVGSDSERKIAELVKNKNLTDAERMMQMQVEMNVWSTITNLRTSMIKVVSDALKTIIRNIN